MQDIPLTPKGNARSLVSSRGWDWLRSAVEEKCNDYVTGITNGVSSWEEYHYSRGVIDGMKQFLGIVDDALGDEEDMNEWQ